MEDLSSPARATEPSPSPSPLPTGRRPWLWAVAGFVAIAVVGGGYWGWTIMTARSLAEARAAAEVHWNAASASLDTIATVTDKLAVTRPADAHTDMTAMTSSLASMTVAATHELDDVSAAVSDLPTSSEKSLYSNAIISARQAVATAGAVTPALAVLPEFYVGAAQVTASLKHARASVNSAILDNNQEKWAPAASSARKALTDCTTAERTLNELKKLRASQPGITDIGDITAALARVKVERALAHGALDLAQAGKGTISTYNAAVASYNKARATASDARDPESLASPVIFAKGALDALRSAKDLVGDARTRHDRALQQSLVAG